MEITEILKQLEWNTGTFPREALLGDFLTEGLPCVLASVCGGDTALIETLIEDPEVEEYARGPALRSLLVLVAAGDRTRDETMAYFDALLRGRLERRPSHAWDALVSCATDLYPEEVYHAIMQAYGEGLADDLFMQLSDVEEVLAQDRQSVLGRLPAGQPVYVQDSIEELENWACFRQPRHMLGGASRERKRANAESLFDQGTHPKPFHFPWQADQYDA